jgi:uncharacterized RDD family membrane protein YckC
MTQASERKNAGLLRRLGAMLYDTLLVVALLIVVTFAFVPLLDGRVLVPEEVGALAYIYWVVQLAAVVAFFMYFWTHRGQTVGMLAWRLRIEKLDGSNMGWQTGLKRLAVHAILLLPFFLGYWLVWRDWAADAYRKLAFGVSLAPAVLPYLWIVFDRERRSWHDRWTDTRVVVLPKTR